MTPLYTLALFIHAAYSTTPCQDGVEIISKETKNPQDLIGNWTTVYHWDNVTGLAQDFIYNRATYKITCPRTYIEPVDPEYVKMKEAECVNFNLPFNWADAKLRLDALQTIMKGSIIVIGETVNWVFVECKMITRVVLKKVPGDNIVLIFPEMYYFTDMLAKRIPTMKELKCVAHNIDVSKDLRNGFKRCASVV